MAGGAPVSSSLGNNSFDENKNYSKPLLVVTTLFFMWGFITCMNDILIPKFKDEFTLSNFQANLVQFAFFSAYFIVSLIYYLISRFGTDPIQKYGYKKAIIAGLIIAAAGCFLFVPAASTKSFGFFLIALFILATGVTILQMGANPYVTLLGKPEGASSRLNMTQAFNSLGTTVAPVIGGMLIFGAVPLAAVNMPYVSLGFLLLGLAALITFTNLPQVAAQSDSDKEEKGIGAVKYSHLVLGVLCIFFYVGGEVSIGSNIIQYLKDVIGLTESNADGMLALYWGGAMIGRFFGAIFLTDIAINTKKVIQIGLLVVFAFGIGIFLVNKKYLLDSMRGEGEFIVKDKIEAFEGASLLKEDKGSIVVSLEDLLNTKKITEVSGGVTLNFEKKEEEDKKTKSKITYLETSYIIPVEFKGENVNISGPGIFTLMVVLNILFFLIGKSKPGRTLGIFSALVLFLLALTTFGTGNLGLWSVLSIGLFNSIMFPTIFSLAIKGLGVDTSQGSSLLVMAIVGGALIPLIQGAIADNVSVQLGFIVPMLCYAYITFYGFIGSKPKNI